MRYQVYTPQTLDQYPLCFLVPTIRKDEIQREYLDRFDIPLEDVLVLDLHYDPDKKKTPAKEMKEFIESELLETLHDMKVKYLVVADSDYFKILTKVPKVDVNLGYVLDCVFGPWKVVYVPNYRSIFYDPEKIRGKISQGMIALLDHIKDEYKEPGNDIIHFCDYPRTDKEIQGWLDKLLEMDVDLSIDIEAFSLKHYSAGIGTISFAWNEHEGIAFPVDYEEIPGATSAPFGRQIRNETVRIMLRDFFERYLRKTIYHNISYDVTVLIYQLYMLDIIDVTGLLNGMNILLRNWDDTKIISYLATNSCAGNALSLKDQAQEFSGNYAQTEIHDITRIPLPDLLEYNLVDSLSTWFVFKKHNPTMIKDQQEDIYVNLFKPATLDIIQMQLTGMPLDKARVIEVKAMLEADELDALNRINGTNLIQQYNYRRKEQWVTAKNLKLKKKRVTLVDAPADQIFNPNSPNQLQDLLYEVLGLPVISLTKTKQPSTDGDTIKALRNHTKDPEVVNFLNAMVDYATVTIILTNFIPSMMDAPMGPDGWHYLFGNFNLGGTVSGRLSSSNPNMQNLPAGGGDPKDKKTIYGKMIKTCFVAPPGWLFCGLDFASLEDKISALTTRDPQKIRVYTDGYDGHSLRAFAYFGDQMTGIDETSVESINSIQVKYKPLRNESKAPTFALTYQGTYHTLMKNLGWPMDKAKKVEENYHQLYKVSTEWVQAKLNQASKDGYITAAFGLRVRTPLLAQVVRGTSKTPYEAEAEGRTAGNALGQSWCLLNSRASAEFLSLVRTSKHRLSIRPCAHIHDAQYMLVKDNIETVMFANEHLVKAVKWQDHPDIQHDQVKLGGEFSIFWPNWSKEIVIPNDASEKQIFEIIEEQTKGKKDV